MSFTAVLEADHAETLRTANGCQVRLESKQTLPLSLLFQADCDPLLRSNQVAIDVTARERGVLQRLVRHLRTRLTTLAQRARFVVIQDGDNVYIEDVVPVECPVRHGLGTVGFTDDHTPTACQIMPAANLFDAAASVCGILLRRHLEEVRIPFVELALVKLPGEHEFHNGFSRVFYISMLNCLTA